MASNVRPLSPVDVCARERGRERGQLLVRTVATVVTWYLRKDERNFVI